MIDKAYKALLFFAIYLCTFSCNFRENKKLNSFEILDNGLEKTNKVFVIKNEASYKQIDSVFALDSNIFRPYYYKAAVVRMRTEELIKYIDVIKTDLILLIDNHSSDNSNDHNEGVTNYFFKGNNFEDTTGKGYEVKNRINEYKSKLLGMTYPEDRDSIKLGLETSDEYSASEDKMVSWEYNFFYHNPAIAVVTLLTKTQNDVRNAEAEVITSLYKRMIIASSKENK